MTESVDEDLYRRTEALLRPGEIELNGAIVHTTYGGDEDLEMHELTVDINDVVAAHAEKGESYIYAGNDDTDFSSNQFQGLTLDGDEFVWECQQLLRNGTFDIVVYYEADADQAAVVDALAALDGVDDVVSVEG
jgi:hypothetical protein